MMKTASQVAANAELARAFADIRRASKHEEEAVLRMFYAQNERNPNGWSDARAPVARSSA